MGVRGRRHLALRSTLSEQAGNPIEHIDIPAALNTTGIYGGAVVKGAAHADAAKKWLAFLKSPDAVTIFESYGFKAYTP